MFNNNLDTELIGATIGTLANLFFFAYGIYSLFFV